MNFRLAIGNTKHIYVKRASLTKASFTQAKPTTFDRFFNGPMQGGGIE